MDGNPSEAAPEDENSERWFAQFDTTVNGYQHKEGQLTKGPSAVLDGQAICNHANELCGYLPKEISSYLVELQAWINITLNLEVSTKPGTNEVKLRLQVFASPLYRGEQSYVQWVDERITSIQKARLQYGKLGCVWQRGGIPVQTLNKDGWKRRFPAQKECPKFCNVSAPKPASAERARKKVKLADKLDGFTKRPFPTSRCRWTRIKVFRGASRFSRTNGKRCGSCGPRRSAPARTRTPCGDS